MFSGPTLSLGLVVLIFSHVVSVQSGVCSTTFSRSIEI